MIINFKFTNTDSDDELKAYALEKIQSFDKLLGKKDADAAICDVEFSHSLKQQSGKVFTAEVNLEVEGKLYRVTKSEPNFKKAIDKVKDDILQSLRADKGKSKNAFRKGGRMLKRLMRGNADE